MTRLHAPISASAMKRRINCIGSYALESRRPSTTSEFAAEGTVAHEVLENKVRHWLHDGAAEGTDVPAIGETISEDGHMITVDQAMHLHAESALKEIKALESQILTVYGESRLNAEIEVELESAFFPGLVGGHSDFIFTYPSVKIVMDYKYGAGVPVDDPTQLLVYAILSFEKAGINPDQFTDVWAIIYQPRVKDDPTIWVLSSAELREFRDKMYSLIPVMRWFAEQIKEDSDAIQFASAFKIGNWCQFCAAQAVCPAMIAAADDVARMMDMTSPHSTGALLKLDGIASRITKFLKMVKDELLKRAQGGEVIPGMKLVDKWSNRQVKDEAALVTYLKAQGIDSDEYYRTSLQTLEVLEKLVGKAKFSEFVARVKTGQELVPDKDSRPTSQSDADLLTVS